MANNENNPNTTSSPVSSNDDNLFKFKKYIKKFWHDFLDLDQGIDKRMVINEIKEKKSMSGPNAWMLMCSIVIASVGLNMNSPAVIIGAMLISPLMSPILGMGLAIGINDKNTLKKSLAHFGMAVFIALVTSSLYFAISPIKEMTPEISARTVPTPLDIFIALFGGIAGIVSIARKDISTTLPGVAIATALMPPVCVAGYGIAMGRFEITVAALFLFFINTVFVSFATYIIVRFFLNFPRTNYTDAAEKKKNTIYIAIFLIAIAVISYFPFHKLLQDLRVKQKVEVFKTEVFGSNQELLDDAILTTQGDSSVLFLKVYGDGEQFLQEDGYASLLDEIGLENTLVNIIPTTNINDSDLKALDLKIQDLGELTSKINVVKEQKTAADNQIAELQDMLSTFSMDNENLTKLTNVIKSVSDNIGEVYYAKGQTVQDDYGESYTPILLIEWKEEKRSNDKEIEMITNVAQSYLGVESVKVGTYTAE